MIAFAALAVAVVILMRPWPEQDYMYPLLIVASCVWLALLLSWWASRFVGTKAGLENLTMVMLLGFLMFQGAIISLSPFFLREHQTNWNDGFGIFNRPVLRVR